MNDFFSLTYNTKTKEYFYNEKIVELEDLAEKEFQLAILAIIFDELNNENKSLDAITKQDYLTDLRKRNLKTSKMCEMAAIGIDYTRSGAKGHSNHAASGFIKSHPGTIVTGQDQGCVWEDFMCIYVISMLYPC
mgnify:FL=1